jgi:hypothetical protein
MATLTTVYGVNNTKREQTVPPVMVAANEQYGRLRVLYDEYTVGASDEFGTSGLIKCFKIPKGAKVYGAHVVCPATGATGIFDIGWAAGATATEAADANGIFAGIDPGAAAVNTNNPESAVMFKTFSEEVEVQIDCTEVTAAMAGLTIKLAVFFSID